MAMEGWGEAMRLKVIFHDVAARGCRELSKSKPEEEPDLITLFNPTLLLRNH